MLSKAGVSTRSEESGGRVEVEFVPVLYENHPLAFGIDNGAQKRQH